MPTWSFPSSIELRGALVAAALALVAAGCSDDAACGPGAAGATLTMTIGGETVTYGGFTSSVNNDCTIAAAGVISVSVHGTQVGGTGSLTLCLPRPDLLGADPVPFAPTRLPPAADDRVQLIDASATLAAGCSVVREPTSVPSGTTTFTGYCAGGTDPGGYALTLAGAAGLRRTCGATTDNVAGTLAGTVAVTVP